MHGAVRGRRLVTVSYSIAIDGESVHRKCAVIIKSVQSIVAKEITNVQLQNNACVHISNVLYCIHSEILGGARNEQCR